MTLLACMQAHILDAHLKEQEREEQRKHLKQSRRDFRKHQEMVQDISVMYMIASIHGNALYMYITGNGRASA